MLIRNVFPIAAYYPWVPLLLSCFAAVPFLISVVWKVFYAKRVGADLQALLDIASGAKTLTGEERVKAIHQISCLIEDSLFKHREYRQGRFANLKASIFKSLGFGFFSKRYASWINFTYLLIKLIYLSNHFLTLVAIHFFLRLGRSYLFFGFKVISDVSSGKVWQVTGLFPRVTFCRVPLRHQVEVNVVYAQCVVPANMLNEVIFVFLWFWHVMAVGVMTVSIVKWLYRTLSRSNRQRFLRRLLLLSDILPLEHRHEKDLEVAVFAKNFLQHDGIFILRMLSVCVGSGVATDVARCLWESFARISDWSKLPRPQHIQQPLTTLIRLKKRSSLQTREETVNPRLGRSISAPCAPPVPTASIDKIIFEAES